MLLLLLFPRRSLWTFARGCALRWLRAGAGGSAVNAVGANTVRIVYLVLVSVLVFVLIV